MILIIGLKSDVTSVTIQQKINARGGYALLWETRNFPKQTKISYNPCDVSEGYFQLTPETPPIAISEIQSVFRRWAVDITVPDEETDPENRQMVYWNVESAIGSFLRCLPCFQINPQDAFQMHRYKAYQLQCLSKAGIRIPQTLVSNRPEDVVTFYERMNKSIIMKSVSGGIYTQKITEAHLAAENLDRLANMPIKFQELIPGMDIRAYVVDDEVFAMEIHSNTLDFRLETYAPRKAIQLPQDVEDTCRQIARLLGLIYTGIDLRRTPDGEYVFFEANPSPIFIFDEMVTDYPISDRIVKRLMTAQISTGMEPLASSS